MAENEHISIIIPSNSRPCLWDALRSIEAGRSPVPHEILIVGSLPEPQEALPGAVRFLPCEGLGTGAMRNLAARNARGSILLFTDSDCIVDSGWIDRAASAVTGGHPFVAGGVRFPETNAWDLGDNLAIFYAVHVSRPAGPARGHIGTNNLAVRHNIFEALGGFNERLTVGEDWEFLDRARRAGHSVWFDPSFAVRHQSGRDSAAAVRAHARWYAEGYARLLNEGHLTGGRWRADGILGRIPGGAACWSAAKATTGVMRVLLPYPPFWRFLRGIPGAWLFYYTRRREVCRQLAARAD
jgi:hypothetical protein